MCTKGLENEKNLFKLNFNNFSYKSNFDIDHNKDLATFNEIFKDAKTSNIRKNEHKLYMPTQKNILSLAKDAGFILSSKKSMDSCSYNHQYLYTLQKPT